MKDVEELMADKAEMEEEIAKMEADLEEAEATVEEMQGHKWFNHGSPSSVDEKDREAFHAFNEDYRAARKNARRLRWGIVNHQDQLKGLVSTIERRQAAEDAGDVLDAAAPFVELFNAMQRLQVLRIRERDRGHGYDPGTHGESVRQAAEDAKEAFASLIGICAHGRGAEDVEGSERKASTLEAVGELFAAGA